MKTKTISFTKFCKKKYFCNTKTGQYKKALTIIEMLKKKDITSVEVESPNPLIGYWFTNEHGSKVTVMTVQDGWCMVSVEGRKSPYVMPEEFVLAIKNS